MNDIKARVFNFIQKLMKSGFGHLFGSSVISKVLGFMSSVILVRLIPKTDYGIYSNADNILGMFCIFEGFGMVSTFLQYGSTNQGEKKKEIWSFCFYFSLLFQIALSIVILFISMTINFSIPGTGILLGAMSFLPIFRNIRDLQQVYLRTEFRNKEYARSNILTTVVTVITSCVFSFFFLTKGLIVASYISVFATIIYVMYICHVKLPSKSNNLTRQEKAKLIKFSTVCVINNSTSSIMYLIDTFVLGIVIASSTVTASYKVASKIPTALAFIPGCVMTYIYPYFAKHKDDGNWCLRNYKKVLVLFGVFNLLMVGPLILFAPYVIRLVFGAQYLDALVSFRLLCLNYIIQATFATVSGQLLVSQEKLGFNTFTGVLSSILNTILNLALIPKYSSVGAAVATVTVTAVVGILSTGFLLNVLKKKRNEQYGRKIIERKRIY